MKRFRKNIFETNSSSTHSFTIENGSYEIKPEIKPDWYAEFGWQWENWSSPEEKLAYICRCLLSYEYYYKSDDEEEWEEDRLNENIKRILTPFQERLANLGVKFEIPTHKDLEKGYVDHADWYQEEIEEIIETDDELLNFLFNYDCEINGGNDNDSFFLNY